MIILVRKRIEIERAMCSVSCDYRPRQRETRLGQIPLRIPKLRQGSYFPSLLEPRKRSAKAGLPVASWKWGPYNQRNYRGCLIAH